MEILGNVYKELDLHQTSNLYSHNASKPIRKTVQQLELKPLINAYHMHITISLNWSLHTIFQSKRFRKIYILRCRCSSLHLSIAYNVHHTLRVRTRALLSPTRAHSLQFTDLPGVHLFVYLYHHWCDVTATLTIVDYRWVKHWQSFDKCTLFILITWDFRKCAADCFIGFPWNVGNRTQASENSLYRSSMCIEDMWSILQLYHFSANKFRKEI